MNINDPIGDMITRIRNAHMRGKEIVDTPSSSLRVNVLEVLKAEGFIRGFSETERDTGQSEIQIELKYQQGYYRLRFLTALIKSDLSRIFL